MVQTRGRSRVGAGRRTAEIRRRVGRKVDIHGSGREEIDVRDG